MRVVVEITEEDFRKLLVKTRAENISEAVKIAVESYLLGEGRGNTRVAQYLSILREEVLERVDELLKKPELNERINKVLTGKLTHLQKDLEKLNKEVKFLNQTIYELKEQVSSLPTETNLSKVQRELKVLEVFLADQVKAVRKDLERYKFLRALEKVNEVLSRETSSVLKVVGENSEGFKVEIESEKLTPNALSTDYLKKLFKDAGLWVIVRSEDDGYLITL